MDPAVLGALSAVMGSIVGGSASIATAWFTQTSQGRREMVRAEVQKREALYAEFIGECSRLLADALGHQLEKADMLVKAYALENRIRLTSSDSVVEAAADTLKGILGLYFQPNMEKDDLRKLPESMKHNPLRAFSDACRKELAGLHYTI
jgi:hypothetical protein